MDALQADGMGAAQQAGMSYSAFVRAVKDVANRKNAAAAPGAAAADPVLAAAGAVTAALDAFHRSVAQADSAANVERFMTRCAP